MTNIRVDFNKAVGKIKPMHCGNIGPRQGGARLWKDFTEEFKEMLYKFAEREYPKHGKVLCVHINELKELMTFVKRVCEKAQMYDDLCK